MKTVLNQKDLDNLTQEEAREWLLVNDREGYEYWSSLDLASDFKEYVAENIRDFGFEELR